MNIKKRIFRKFKPFFQRLMDKYFYYNRTSGEVGDADFHVDLVVHLASILRPDVYVELGVHKGETFNRTRVFSKEGYAVDINESSKNYLNEKSCFYHGTSSDFLNEFMSKGKKIDLLFIDADHSAVSVREDFLGYFPLVSDNGIILLHDGYPLNENQTSASICGDGYKAIWELSNAPDGFELVTIPFSPGLTICRKRSSQVPWDV